MQAVDQIKEMLSLEGTLQLIEECEQILKKERILGQDKLTTIIIQVRAVSIKSSERMMRVPVD